MKWLVGAVLVAGCGTSMAPTGSTLMKFDAEPLERVCDVDEVPGTAFSFRSAIITGAETQLWMSGYLRPATLEAGHFVSTDSARRVFSPCFTCQVTLEETIDVTLLTAEQAAALGNQCPDDGSRPMPAGAAPVVTPTGSDVLLACGRLTTSLAAMATDGGNCGSCNGCRVTYRLRGDRQ